MGKEAAGAPSTVDLNVLWSIQSFGGNWQLSASDITVNFVDTCAIDSGQPQHLTHVLRLQKTSRE